MKRRPSSPPRPARLTARAVAITVLARVEQTDAWLNVVLDAALDEHPLADPRDRPFVTELCYGATRRRAQLDAALRQVSDRGLDTLEDRVLAALRLGAYQLFFLRVPAHAAVADTVQAAKDLGLARAAGFVNAVLRKVATMPGPPHGGETPAAALALEHSHPEWLVRRWLRHFGAEAAARMLAADNEPPALVVRANLARTSRDALVAELQAAGVQVEPTALSPTGLRLGSPGKPEELFGYAEGLWQVQDEAAQLVGHYAAVPEGARVLDACAAPGGKACHLAERNPVLALDVHANKLHRIEAEAKRLGLVGRVRVRAADASKALPEELGAFDAVLVDAPCSGLGTLRRHPELRYRRQEEDVARLARLQRAILESCQAVVAPGGLLVYSVCTTEPEEGADQVELFLRSHPDFTAEPPPPGVPFPLWQGYLRTVPGPEGLDGFFAARLRRLY